MSDCFSDPAYVQVKHFMATEQWEVLTLSKPKQCYQLEREMFLRHEASLTLPEISEVWEQDVCVVGRRETHHVVLGHLAQGLAVQRLEEHDVHLLQDVLLDGPVQPLSHVVLSPNLRIWHQEDREQREAQNWSAKTPDTLIYNMVSHFVATVFEPFSWRRVGTY